MRKIIVECANEGCESRVIYRPGEHYYDHGAVNWSPDMVLHGWIRAQPSNWASPADFCTLACLDSMLDYMHERRPVLGEYPPTADSEAP